MRGSETTSEAAPRGVFGGGAWQIGRVSGIDIAVDHTWLLIFFLVTVSVGSQIAAGHEEWGRALVWTAAGVTSFLFFASIVLHELGHSLVAQRLGVGVRSITLFVFGGLAKLDSEPKRPRDEVMIALAGPLVSVGLGVLFSVTGAALGGAPASAGAEIQAVAGESLAWLGRINLILAAFNVVPGFPLDGGRVLRGVVWAYTGSFERATTVAAGAGSLFAYGLISMGALIALVSGQFVSGLWLAFIGWFLLSAARATVSQLVIERILEAVRARDVMEGVDDGCVSGDASVEHLVQHAVLQRGRRTFYVVGAGGRLQGLVTLRELAQVPPEERGRRRVDEVMIGAERLVAIHPGDDGWKAFLRMAERGVNQLPVVEDGRLVGALTRERLMALVQTRIAFAREGLQATS